jgi:hypothetical protein
MAREHAAAGECIDAATGQNHVELGICGHLHLSARHLRADNGAQAQTSAYFSGERVQA